MKITLLCTGKTNDRKIAELMQLYTKRIEKYCRFQLIETADVKSAGPDDMKKKEASHILKHTSGADAVILLDERGKEMTSEQFSKFISKKQVGSTKHLIFIIGGAYGFHHEIYALASDKIALSKMTFPHQLVRLFFVEQLYRAFSFLHNEPYHHS